MKGQYVVYERAARREESLSSLISQRRSYARSTSRRTGRRRQARGRRRGGRPYEYEFRPMLIVLMLMVYRQEGLSRDGVSPEEQPAPPQGTRPREGSVQILDTLGRLEDRHSTPSPRSTTRSWPVQKNLGRPRKKHVAIDSSGLGIRRRSAWYSIRTHSSPSKKRDFRKLHLASECHGQGQADLLLDAHVGCQARLSRGSGRS